MSASPTTLWVQTSPSDECCPPAWRLPDHIEPGPAFGLLGPDGMRRIGAVRVHSTECIRLPQ